MTLLHASRSLAASADEDEAPVASPCVQVCLYEPTLDACRGCFRSLDEIAHWSIYTAAEQRAVLERASARRAAAGAQAPG